LKKLKPSRYFKTFRAKDYTLNNIVIDIIIPVYNGYKFLNPLFDSLERNTFPAHRLIVVNDCSPDEKVKPLLKKRLEKYPSSIFIDHKENQGFLKSVNEAYSYISDHFIILNTDTEVPAFWIERLMYPIVHMEKISSTTPFTNSGEIASFPNFLADNDIFEDMSVDKLDEVFRDINPKYFYEEVPTGVGFCMGVNYHLTKEIGLFVEDTFGKGYGEENDWCQRAIQKGYKNYLVPNLFVYHKHGGSFSAEEKRKLLKENSIKLLAKHPNYGKDVDAYIEKNPHESLRNILVMIASARVRSIDIIFDHDLGGGANIYKNKLLEKYAKEERNTLEIKFDFYSNMFKISHKYKNYTSSFSVDTFSELTLLLEKIDIREIFLNSLVSYKGIYEILEYINDIVEKHNIVLTIPIHDYNPISANYTLLCADGAYHDDLSLEGCQKCIENNDLEWRSLVPDEINLKLWRELWFKLLKKSDNILCFSNSSKDILLSAYPVSYQTPQFSY
ncbi:MAG TPA: glycosyltransferase family 2 protein, partial [Methanosarcinales archaeon]|nr:glycosyltransferase family 2 protein [Methanosarcinales archaeon]